MLKQAIVEVSAEFIGFMIPIILVVIVYQAIRLNIKHSQSKTTNK